MVLTKQQAPRKSESRAPTPYFQDAQRAATIYNADFLKLNAIPAESIDLTVTSPPYNVDINYNSSKDDGSYADYLKFTRDWLARCYELTKHDGRICLNIPLDKNKGGQQPVLADITGIARVIGWQYQTSIIWNESNISRRTAWGSFMSASAPYVIAPVEMILVMYKGVWKKTSGSRQNDIDKKDFIDWTSGVWTFSGQSKKGAGGHPAAFPVELPKRCVKLFSFVGDAVLDPFVGSGSTLIAASANNRVAIGVEVDKDYCDIAIKRLQKEAQINLPLKDGKI